MKTKLANIVLYFVTAISVILIGSVPMESAHAHWWDELGTPKYGGTFTTAGQVQNVNLNLATPIMGASTYWCESLFAPDWTLDPDEKSFDYSFATLEYYQGLLAESWEQTDPHTITVHIRKGIHWQNKPPVNGRELTAEDIQFNYDMQLGKGSGFTKPNPMKIGLLSSIERVVATDKYTIVFKLKTTSIWSKISVVDPLSFIYAIFIMPPEQAQAGAADPTVFTDWHNAVGTGPWLLKDFVASTSMTLTRNPNYWGHDERYPQNQIPYIQTYKILSIPDITSQLTAIRTKKIDMVPAFRGLSPQGMASLSKSNPEIIPLKRPFQGPGIDFRCDRKPFTDIRVRKALQLAIDIPALAKAIYGGTVNGKPAGLISPNFKGWTIPFDRWPKDLQDEYSYNPQRARELLAEAGYPNGFSTNVVIPTGEYTELMEAVKSLFRDIGVDMEIKAMDRISAFPYLMSGKHDQLACAFGASVTGMAQSPYEAVSRRTAKDVQNFAHNDDPQYEALVRKVGAATSIEEAQQACIEADMYSLRKHWTIHTFPINFLYAIQPWVKGFSNDPGSYPSFWTARWWIDKD